MKTTVLILSLIVLSGTVYSQTEKGNFMVSGSTGLQFISSHLRYMNSGVTQEEMTVNSFSFIPSGGYFVIDNLAVGLACNITSSSTKYEGETGKSVTTSILVLPVAIYYFPVKGNLKPIVQVGAGLASMIQKYSGEDSNSATGLAVSFGGGIAYFITEKLSLNFGLSYTMASMKDADNENAKLKEGNFGANIGIGFYF